MMMMMLDDEDGQNSQQAKHHRSMTPAKLGMRKLPFFPDTCRMMQVKRGMQKLPFFPTFEDQKSSSCIPNMQSITPGPHPRHAKHHPGQLQENAGEAGDAKAASFYNYGRPKRQPPHPQHAKHRPRHLHNDEDDAGDDDDGDGGNDAEE